MIIQWYPGHMAKARRMLEENLKLIDVVVEVVDARAPRSTSNPDFDALFRAKKRIMVLNKADMADQAATKRWIEYYKQKQIAAFPFVSISGNKKQAIAAIEEAAAERVAFMKQKGVNKTVRVMIVGIPNVGKSTFINCIAGGARAKVGDKPGVTKGKQWVRITPLLELMDTPGLLWPKLDNERFALRLAFLGSIKDDIMDIEELASRLLVTLRGICPGALAQRYAQVTADTPETELLQALCRSRGFRLRAGEWDMERGARVLLDEFRGAQIARVTLDDPREQVGEEQKA